ncbi:MAG: pilus assembly protein TadG-related protein [Chloroflexota bacterium]|nr:pilus assembly protein TadG-related protein [Chloroflexota bacterium]
MLRKLLSKVREERGQGLVLAALAMVVVLGFTAMAVDVGMFMHEKRQLQNAADAAALAGAQDLPVSPADAVANATTWAQQNGIGPGELEAVTVSMTYATDDTITVQVKRDVPWLFARVLGFTSDTMRADATARVGSPAWASNVMPFSLKESVQASVTYGQEVILKFSAGDKENGPQCNNSTDDDGDTKVNDGCPVRDGAPESGAQCDNAVDDDSDGSVNDGCPDAGASGDFGLLDLGGGQGCDAYRDNIVNGAEVAVNSTVPSEPGNCVGPTEQGLETRLEGTSTACDTFEETFQLVDGAWRFANNECDPWEADGAGSKRVVLVPVISDTDQGKSYVTVYSLALVYLTNEATDNICPTGNECDVKGIFVKAYDDIGVLMGALDPNSDIRFARLVE